MLTPDNRDWVASHGLKRSRPLTFNVIITHDTITSILTPRQTSESLEEFSPGITLTGPKTNLQTADDGFDDEPLSAQL